MAATCRRSRRCPPTRRSAAPSPPHASRRARPPWRRATPGTPGRLETRGRVTVRRRRGRRRGGGGGGGRGGERRYAAGMRASAWVAPAGRRRVGARRLRLWRRRRRRRLRRRLRRRPRGGGGGGGGGGRRRCRALRFEPSFCAVRHEAHAELSGGAAAAALPGGAADDVDGDDDDDDAAGAAATGVGAATGAAAGEAAGASGSASASASCRWAKSSAASVEVLSVCTKAAGAAGAAAATAAGRSVAGDRRSVIELSRRRRRRPSSSQFCQRASERTRLRRERPGRLLPSRSHPRRVVPPLAAGRMHPAGLCADAEYFHASPPGFSRRAPFFRWRRRTFSFAASKSNCGGSRSRSCAARLPPAVRAATGRGVRGARGAPASVRPRRGDCLRRRLRARDADRRGAARPRLPLLHVWAREDDACAVAISRVLHQRAVPDLPDPVRRAATGRK